MYLSKFIVLFSAIPSGILNNYFYITIVFITVFYRKYKLDFINKLSILIFLILPYYLYNQKFTSIDDSLFVKSYFFLILPLFVLAIVSKCSNVLDSIKLVIIGNIIYCIIKSLILLFIFFDPIRTLFYIDENFPNLIVYSNIGFIDIPRFVCANDYITPFCIYFCITRSYLKWFLPLLIFSSLLTISFHILAVLILILLYVTLKFSVTNPIKSLFIIFIFISLLTLSYTGFKQRSTNDFLPSSNSKLYQSKLLLSKFTDTPFWGQGFGYYLPSYVRNNKNPFLYENFFFSYLMQSGLLFSLIYIIIIFYNNTCYSINKILLLALFLSYGLTNPVIITPPTLLFLFTIIHYKV